jgi:hypothetical protein
MRISLTKPVWNEMIYPKGTPGRYIELMSADDGVHKVELTDAMGVTHPVILFDDEFRYVSDN